MALSQADLAPLSNEDLVAKLIRLVGEYASDDDEMGEMYSTRHEDIECLRIEILRRLNGK